MSSNKIIDPRISVIASGLNQPYAAVRKDLLHDGVLLTAGIDVQRDRLSILLRAWGAGMTSWLVYWDEIYGETTDFNDPVYSEAAEIVFGDYMHEMQA